MMPDELLKNTLDALGIPVGRIFLKTEADAFLVFQLIYESGNNFADDENQSAEDVFLINLYAKKAYSQLLNELKQKLKNAGFYGIVVEAETYESDSGYYHVPVSCRIQREED